MAQVHERTKKLKATLVTLQGQMERKFDQRLKAHLEGFDAWQGDLQAVTTGRLKILEDRIKDQGSEFDDFKDTSGSEIQDVQDSGRATKEWATREFSSCNAQTLNLQVMIHKVVERVDAMEKSSKERSDYVEALATEIRDKLAEHDKKSTDSTERFGVIDARLHSSEERSDKQEKELADHDGLISGILERVTWQDGTIGETAVAQKQLDEKFDDALLKVQVLEVKGDREREERLSDIKLTKEAHQDLTLRVDDVNDAASQNNVDISDLANVVRTHPDKIEFMEEALEKLEQTIAGEAETREALKATLADMVANQKEFVKVQNDIATVVQKVEKQEEKTEALVVQQVEMKEEAVKIQEKQAEVEEYVAEVNHAVEAVETKAAEQEEQVQMSVRAVRQETKAAQQKVDEMKRIVEDDDPTASSSGKNKRSTMASRPPAQQKKFVENEAKGIAAACFAYEKLCVAKNYLSDFPSETVMAISESTLEMATFITGRVDMWALGQRMMERPADRPFGDEDIAKQKDKEQDEWISSSKDRVQDLCDCAPSALQLKARDNFFEKCSLALRMGMSKHDQVLVTQEAIIKRSQDVPTCVACNRPLPQKQSRAEQARRKKVERETVPPATGPARRGSRKGSARPDTAPPPHPDDPDFIMRGGFKMPRKADESGDPHAHASLPPLRPAPESGEQWVDKPPLEDPNDDWVGAWNAEEAAA